HRGGSMRVTLRWSWWAVLVGSLLMSLPAQAGDSVGTYSVFASGSGNRALAMGSAFVATADDPSALVWNPAGLVGMRRPEFQFSQSNGLGIGIYEAMLAVGYPDWRWGAAALSIRTFGIDGLERRDERNLLVANDVSDRELEVMLGYSNHLGPAISLGGALKAQRQSIGGYSAMGAGVDVGLRMLPGRLLSRESAWVDRLVFGLAVRNLI